ncbi:MAG: electron transfer flavoprotein subunit beta/FixA family protein [Flavobacteriales bacterium]|nr:electron transfer flavoprotein subunit beta/FixA family protein [Flavobacteriales bacterium]
MKLLVCISKAPDTTTKITFAENNTKFNEAGVQFIINPYDEWYALVRAIELKEQNGGSVTVLMVGDASCDPIIRKALAIGADDAVRVDAVHTDSLAIAQEIANFAKDKSYDIIFSGKETIDYNGSQVPSMVASLLDMPFVSLANKLEVSGSVATLERDVQGGVEVLEAQLPFVLSASKGMAEQRIPNMRGIMASRTKPLAVEASTASSNAVSVESYELPPEKGACTYVESDNINELIRLLHEEAKVL